MIKSVMGSVMKEVGLWVLAASLLWLSGKGCSQVAPQVPCFFIFGDSLVDNGNNNGFSHFLEPTIDLMALTSLKVPVAGLLMAELSLMHWLRRYGSVAAQLLGFQNNIPPYARTRGQAILSGLNFASGAAGIRDETGNNLGDHISMNQQVNNFGSIVQQMRRYFREDINSLGSYLGKCIYYSGLGSNDYLNNYFMRDFYNTGSQLTPQAYANALIHDYSNQLTCKDLILNAQSYGFEVIDKGCCGVGRNNGQVTCLPLQQACRDRSKYIFWDAFHPTEAANIVTARLSYSSRSPSYTYPINIQQLASL
ncbi:hypothetical protein L1987_44501 [Smallanthus sonchifolius]|uniref:Uncharacterized protein n=1 Tax=Smallanthus sonchifolius TaxID=185202 RepID=A0ACB9GQE2_9ASTR|nr:hypothetical protein L1987_44501 [Smallanthus sonchifolius]